jgi:cytochrome b561
MAIDAEETIEYTEVRREGYTMAFYVAICLIAALVATDPEEGMPTTWLIWGTTIGLALAHLFAFRLASRLVSEDSGGPQHRSIAVAQLIGAATVAIVATVPVLLFSGPTEADMARFFVSGLLGFSAYQIGRQSGAGSVRSALFAGATLIVATVVVLIKNLLLDH